ncbi:hypothetical protein CERSUDRAFT_162052 [Gelatoporia subvermispora B]|uniref:Uncharacterized protein n=1 Tax=Ceriporiopsis subvermispora (strain B) TaxID=914234 RepID=M2R229_CERS8|nr:hypothetical protein CERSUDRAFT_162052 [Gelatoporia subvermispora B]
MPMLSAPLSRLLAATVIVACLPAMDLHIGVLPLTASAGQRTLRAFVLAVIILNFRSWPFSWTFRTLGPLIKHHLRYLVLRIRLSFSPQSAQKRGAVEFGHHSNIATVGQDPFKTSITYRTFASPDDCDFRLHLSNSSYAKTLDAARVKYAVQCFPTFFHIGGWMGLGATYYKFHREISLGSPYEIRTSILTWDSKWTYLVTRFVTQSRPSMHKKGANNRDLTNRVSSGVVCHCIAVSMLCCKIGRITIPPALALATEGFCDSGTDGDENALTHYSRDNPPPHWKHPFPQGATRPRSDLPTLRRFLTHGWRDVPQGSRWWEQALQGTVEKRRIAGMEVVNGMTDGLSRLEETTWD